MNYRRWLIVGYLLVLMAFTTSVLLIPGQKYDTLTTSDSGWVYDQAVDIDENNGIVENNRLSHAPYGLPYGGSAGQALTAVMLYRAIHAVSPSTTLMDVARYYAPLLFALTLIPIFLIGKELGGDLGGCLAAFFGAVMTSSIYWMKVGAFDREPIQLILATWTMYLAIRLFKAPHNSVPQFAVLTGLMYGLFGLSWAGWWYLAPAIVGGLLFVIGVRFLEKLMRGTKGPEAAISTTREHLSTIAGVIGILVVMTIVLCTLGGQNPRLWEGVAGTVWGYAPKIGKVLLGLLLIGGGGLFGYLCIEGKAKKLGAGWFVFAVLCAFGIYWLSVSGGEGGISFSRYASEMAVPASWSDTAYKFYGVDGAKILSVLIFALITFALIKFCWSRKRWELLAFPWLIVLMGLVWPGMGQARFERMWWPLVPVLAGVGVAVLISFLRRLSFEQFGGWVEHLRKPVLIAFCASTIATPFILNAYRTAEDTTPPTEWRSVAGRDEGFMDAFEWIRENKDTENSIFTIQWSFGHVFTGTARRATVCDGCEIRMEEGTWENETGIVRPPDYIYTVRDSRAYIYGVDISPISYAINGRRIDVQRLPLMGEDEFEWIISTYRDNYNCKIDYAIFDRMEYYNAIQSYQNSVMAALWYEAALNQMENVYAQDSNLVFNFGENRESVVFDQQNFNVYLTTDGDRLYFDGYAQFTVNEAGQFLDYQGFSPYPSPDISETLVIFATGGGNIVGAKLIPSASALINAIEIPIGVCVFTGYMDSMDYLQIAYTSSNDMVKVVKVNHVPSLTSPAEGARTNDVTPTFQWSSAPGAAGYELWVDNNADFSSPEILENVSSTTYTPAAPLAEGTHSWRVRAFKADNTELGWSPTCTFVIDTTPPAAAVLHAPENGATSDNTPTFEWTVGAGAAKHRLLVDNDADFSTPEVDILLDMPENTYASSELAVGSYMWKLIAIDDVNNENESPTWEFTVSS